MSLENYVGEKGVFALVEVYIRIDSLGKVFRKKS
ncbi:hypothetical protein ABID39_000058 [Bartonella japonica]|uniref:Uncharacterized protein n=1 Tax=Bartonella japonica TaxID=357761 RepID=A0ABV2FLC1_9HYPH